MNNFTAELNALIDEAATIVTRTQEVGTTVVTLKECKGYACGEINGHTVSVRLRNALRGTGRVTQKGVYWKVDGKVTPAERLSQALA